MLVVTLISGPEFEALPTGAGRDKSGIARPAIQMPLPNKPGPITGFLQDLCECYLRFAQAQIVRDHSVDVWIGAGHENGPGRTTDRRIRIGPLEEHPLRGEPVDVRCFHIRIAHAAHGRSTHLIRQDEKNVWPEHRDQQDG
jgi:hypothetical protein